MDASLVVAITLATAVGFVAFTMAMHEVVDMFDECQYYGHDGPDVIREDGCQSIRSTSETRGDVVLRLLLVQGSALVAMGMTWYGGGRDDGRWFAAATVIFGALTIALLLGLFWYGTIAAAIASGVAAYRRWPT